MRATTTKRPLKNTALLVVSSSNPAQIALKHAQQSQQDAAAQMVGLWGDTARLWMDASMTIGWRMPFLMRLDATTPEVARERTAMVEEKMKALTDTGLSAFSAATVFAAALSKGPSLAGATEAAARAMRSTMKPSADKAKSNAKRLTARALNKAIKD